ncbi:hypothetical protein AAG570_005067 [Ranatra chinensis]|uniref:Reverse transcriptase domain-containing protein n=1 Tax=Ranatra chinensis TaxID=642074 RepID=A0ABD0Y101_9HEMI
MASKRRNMSYQDKKQETTEKGAICHPFVICATNNSDMNYGPHNSAEDGDWPKLVRTNELRARDDRATLLNQLNPHIVNRAIKVSAVRHHDQISFALEKKEYCGGVFLDVAQAFDRVWHPGLLFKLKRILPSTYYLILQSYLTNCYSVVCHGEKLSGYIQIKASVPQGSVLGPLLYLVYTADIPTQTSTSMATFADDICILSSHPDPNSVSLSLQNHLNRLELW